MLVRLRRLQSRLSRVPFPFWAFSVCLLAAIPGALIFDDYGAASDEKVQRHLGHLTLDYITGGSAELLAYKDRQYGVAFEAPLALAERMLGLEDSRNIYLLRHLLTHLFFIAGAFFAALLAYRMTGHRWLSLFALLLFLLHPRLYAHSFFNSKDLPFLSMFVIALYLAHRAFRRDTLGAFVLCGIAVGLLTNIRIMGVMLFPAVIALRGIDFGYEFRRRERRRHLLLTTAGFAAAAVLTLYAAWPWLWGDPLARFAEAFAEMSNFRHYGTVLFQGELMAYQSPPWDYIPVWLALTTPPATLLLALAGAGTALYRSLAQPGDSLRNTARRFELLLLAGLILPVIAVIALDSTLYDGWRQMYFLYAPLCLLAVVGLQGLLAAVGRARPRRRPAGGGRAISGRPAVFRGAVYGLAAVGLVSAAIQMGQLHPFQSLYFNFLVDRQTPEYLNSQYYLGYQRFWERQQLEYLLERYPDSLLRLPAARTNRDMLPEAQRQRVITCVACPGPFDFFIWNPEFADTGLKREAFAPVIRPLQVYHNTFSSVAALDLSLLDDAAASSYRERYQSVVAGEPVIRSEFDVYLQGRTLSWVQEPCRPETLGWGMEVALYPAEGLRLPPHRRQHGSLAHERRPWLRFDGQCFGQADLQEFDLTRFSLSIDRYDPATGAPAGTWVGHYYPGLPEVLDAIGRQRESAPPPAAGPQWEAFQEGAQIIYAKAGCEPHHREAGFFLHLTPANPGDLPEGRRKYGYDNLDFQFEWRGLELGDECVAIVPLPDYPVAAVATGQYTGAGRLWETALPIQ